MLGLERNDSDPPDTNRYQISVSDQFRLASPALLPMSFAMLTGMVITGHILGALEPGESLSNVYSE